MNYLLNKELHNKASSIISIFLIVMLAMIASKLLWSMVERWGLYELPAPPANLRYSLAGNESSGSGGENAEQLSRRIASTHLFGKKIVEKRKVVKKKSAPKTRLPIKLIGVFGNGQHGRAIIEYKKLQKSYAVGDGIDNVKAVLQEIYANYVIIVRNGREERIELEANLLSKLFRPKPKREMLQNTSSHELSLTEISANMKRFRDEVIEDPNAALKKVLYIPEKGTSGLAGYRIVSGANDRMFLAKFGLRNGDLVTSVNGIDLISIDQGIQALYELESADEVVVNFSRAGRPLSLTVPLD